MIEAVEMKLSRSRWGNRAKEDVTRVAKNEKIQRAWLLRTKGLSMPAIAKEMGASVAGVFAWLNAYKKEVHDNTIEVAAESSASWRALSIARCEGVILQANQVIQGLISKGEKDDRPSAVEGDPKRALALARAHLVLLKADERLAAYTGAEMPREVNQRVTVDSVAPIVVTVADLAKMYQVALENEGQ